MRSENKRQADRQELLAELKGVLNDLEKREKCFLPCSCTLPFSLLQDEGRRALQ